MVETLRAKEKSEEHKRKIKINIIITHNLSSEIVFLMAMIPISVCFHDSFLHVASSFTLPQAMESMKAESRPNSCAISLLKCAVPDIQ